jgi:ubiquinol-cytochrome c reductase iron-sulfur subunit
MAETASAAAVHEALTTVGNPDPHKRDFLKLVTGAAVAIGACAIAWPFLDSMNPAADVLALSSVEVDIAPVEPGSGITVVWRGKPIFVRHRTPEEIKTDEAVKLSQLIDPATDESRHKPGKPEWVIMIGICTHLGCVPLGNKPTDPRGDYGGYLCPCHGSQYDAAGRVRHGPAPLNLFLPPYDFANPTRIKIG